MIRVPFASYGNGRFVLWRTPKPALQEKSTRLPQKKHRKWIYSDSRGTTSGTRHRLFISLKSSSATEMLPHYNKVQKPIAAHSAEEKTPRNLLPTTWKAVYTACVEVFVLTALIMTCASHACLCSTKKLRAVSAQTCYFIKFSDFLRGCLCISSRRARSDMWKWRVTKNHLQNKQRVEDREVSTWLVHRAFVQAPHHFYQLSWNASRAVMIMAVGSP